MPRFFIEYDESRTKFMLFRNMKWLASYDTRAQAEAAMKAALESPVLNSSADITNRGWDDTPLSDGTCANLR